MNSIFTTYANLIGLSLSKCMIIEGISQIELIAKALLAFSVYEVVRFVRITIDKEKKEL